ncbi:cell division protein [Leptolyngbya sp. NIES-3755]|nr:cell division protein [Leptolyngbya sp. NIES-3755]
MSELFKGFEQLLELAKLLEEKAEKGELKANVQINRGAAFSSIPRNTSVNRPAQSPAPEVVVTPPPANPVSLQNVGGLREVLQELRELVELPLKRPEVLAKLGLEPIRGVLLAGSPGTGKTLTARSLSEELGVNYIAIAAPEVMGKYYGEAEARLRSIFEKAAASTPCIIFIDEIDSLAPDRAKVEGEVEKRVVAQLLTLMDGFAQTKGVIVLAATNRPDQIDPALRRPGRFDREIQFRVPDRNGRLEILKILTRSMPLSSVDLEVVADQTVGMVGADLKAVCQKAAYIALRRQVPSLEAVPDQLSIEQSDFLQALKEIKPSVLRSVEVESPNIAWEQIGGLEDIKRTLQEAVEGAMLYPELFQQTGAKAPRGILLWGLPGTGKTLLAKAVASQARANFIAVNGAELMSRWVGAAEQEVRDLFNKARQASPCVVFIDEIDTLAPARGKFNGDSGVSDRVVGQLLTELDGLQDCGTVLLIGATNRPDELDPALLRAGRLDLQIEVSLPDQSSRFAILQVHNVDRPLADVDLDAIAQSTEGWNGADLALLSNQAALQAIRRYRAQGMMEPENLQITGEDFSIAYQALLSQRR